MRWVALIALMSVGCGSAAGVAPNLPDAQPPSSLDAVGAPFSKPLCSRDGWCWQTPLPEGLPLVAVWSNGPDHAYAASNGSVIRFDPPDNFELAQLPTDGIRAIWGTSDTDIWAVGDSRGGHFDGTVWTSFNEIKGGPYDRRYSCVWGTSPTNVWAGGGVMAHWDGASWTMLTPKVNGSHAREYVAIAGTGPDDVWVVGTDEPSDGPYRGVAFHYDGKRWSDARFFPLPLKHVAMSPEGDVLFVEQGGRLLDPDGSVISEGPFDDVYNAGDTLFGLTKDGVVRRTNEGWQLAVRSPVPLRSLGGSRDNVWAVGEGGAIAHYDGKEWRFGGGNANGRSVALSAHDEIVSAVERYKVELLRWDGVSATKASSPLFFFMTFDAPRWNDAWLVGDPFGDISWRPHLVHFDGSTFTTPTSLNAGTVSSSSCAGGVCFYAIDGAVRVHDGVTWKDIATSGIKVVWAASATDAWFAGTAGVVHYDGATTTPITIGTTVSNIGGTGGNDVWFVGNGSVTHWNGAGLEHFDDAIVQFKSIASSASKATYASGSSGLESRSVYRLDGSSWQPLTVPVDFVEAGPVYWHGRVYVGQNGGLIASP